MIAGFFVHKQVLRGCCYGMCRNVFLCDENKNNDKKNPQPGIVVPPDRSFCGTCENIFLKDLFLSSFLAPSIVFSLMTLHACCFALGLGPEPASKEFR